MSSEPIATIDPSQFDLGDAYPLTIAADGVTETPDLVLDGELVPAAGAGYSYTIALDAKVDYKLLLTELNVASGLRAVLTDGATGGLYWANDAALHSLGLEPGIAPDVLTFDAPTELKLVIAAPADSSGDGTGIPFRFEAYADLVKTYTDNPIFRFTNTANGTFLYTASADEVAYIADHVPGMRPDGIAFIGDDEARPGYLPVHRFASLSGGGWYFSIDDDEVALMLANPELFRDEGIGFYVPAEFLEGITQPVYRADNADVGGMLLTINPIEKLYYMLYGGWLDHGIAFLADTTLDPEVPAGSEPIGQSPIDPLG